MSKFEKIKNIIKNKKDEYVIENKDLTIKQNKDNFKKMLKSSDEATNYLLLVSPFVFIAWLSFFINIANNLNDNSAVAALLLFSLFCTIPSSMVITIMMFCFFGDFLNPAYIIYKLKPKKIKKKMIIKTLETNFINVCIDSKTINEISNYLTKEDMLEFLSENKSNPSYNALCDFCDKKEEDEKKALENKHSKILLNALVDDMYSKDKALN